MDQYEIEDTDHWLGSPTLEETRAHYVNMLEGEMADLRVLLRNAQRNITGLIETNAQLSAERVALVREVQKYRTGKDIMNVDGEN
ncbi:hypothetical protein J3P91_10840 [Pseudomonas sp. Z4-7]|uniref:hypothetical protein n=1 Tax=Pseudomonas sp. Z4-7 TaxID=2817413 RepID=UPI003DA867BC